jgi:hypothetical protein
MLHLKTHMKLTVPPFGVRKRLVSVSLAAMLAALAFAVLRWLPASASPHYVPREVISSPARLSDHVSIRAIGGVDPRVSLRNGHDLLTSYQGPEHLQRALTENQAQPRSLASADFDEDGVPDLVGGYGHEGRGIVTLLRGNVDAIYPNAPEAQQRRTSRTFTPAPFLSPARVFSSPAAADFIGAGDFDGDSHLDVVVASGSRASLYLLSGDGQGNLNVTNEIQLPGVVSAMTTGEINRADGLADIVVGVTGKDGARVLMFEGPKGALRTDPEVFPAPATVTALALGQLDSSDEMDLAIGAGAELILVHGRDRKLSLDLEPQQKPVAAKTEARTFESEILSLVSGDFAENDGPGFAVLTRDGQVTIVRPRTAGSQGQSQLSVYSRQDRTSRINSSSQGSLIRAEISSAGGDELLLLDGMQLQFLSYVEKGNPTFTNLEASGRLLAALPMRLDSDGLADFVVLQSGKTWPAIATTLSSTAAGIAATAVAIGNPNAITINDTFSLNFRATPYPSTVNVTGLVGTISKLRVRLSGLSYSLVDNLDMLLVGPAGQKVMLMSDVSFVSASNVVVTFDDAASSDLSGGVVNGTYKATDINDGPDNLPSPAPGAPYATTLATFNGTNPNGTWSLYVAKDVINSLTGSISGGWTLYFGADDPRPPLVVTNTNDSGAGSLRQAILDANASLGPDLISFSIGSGAKTIKPNSALPIISETVLIDATTQPGFAGQPLIELDLTNAGNTVNGFLIESDATVIRGFVINHMIPASTLTGGILIRRGQQNIIEGNYIGTDINGTLDAAPFGSVGVEINSSNNTIGGTTAAARNLLSGLDTGVRFFNGFSQPPSNNRVQGNYIGTNPTGSAALPNDFFGIDIRSPSNLIGGTSAGSGNLISGNGFSGVWILGTGTQGNLVQGNLLGTNAQGTSAIPNNDGVSILNGASNNTIGGSTGSARNVISGNGNGVAIGQAGLINSTPNNTVRGNYIGTDITGSVSLANGRAIQVPANVVGSEVSLNRIAFNRFVGVEINELGGNDAPGIRVAIFDNEIYANGGLGIDLGPTGITPNDPLDVDAGANLRQNFPVLTSATASAFGETILERAGEVGREMPDPIIAAALTINGTLNSTPNTNFTVHWYFSAGTQCTSNQAASRPLAFGKVPDVITNGSGNATFSIPFDFPSGISDGIINCTATDPQGNTSEFSACFPVGTTPGPTPTPTAMPTPTVTPTPTPTPSPGGPMIFVEAGTNNLAALDSVTLLRGPFALTNIRNFSSDQRTRIIFYTTDLGFAQSAQPDINTLSVQMGGNSYTVESVGPDSTISGSYIVFRLPDLAAPGTYPLGIRIRGVNSANTPNVNLVSSPSSPAAAPKSNKAKLADYLLFPLIDLIF